MDKNNNNEKLTKVGINWYPGHMARTKKQINELLPLIDIVYELVDARIPVSSRISDIDEIIKNKSRIMIMTKKDLCDLEESRKWVQKYEEEGYKVVIANLQDNNSYKEILAKTNELREEINNKRIAKGLKPKEIRALVIGIPNVGKSTFINQLARKKVANVGNRPGVTTNLSWLKTNLNILLLDTPGILWPKFESQEVALNLASFSAIRSEVIDTNEVAVHILNKLSNYYPNILKMRYNIERFDSEDIIDSYETIGKKIGALIKGGEIDYDRVSQAILNDIRNEFVKNITFDRYE